MRVEVSRLRGARFQGLALAAVAVLAHGGEARGQEGGGATSRPAAESRAAEEEPEGAWARTMLDLRYVFRTTSDRRERDQDLFQDLFAEGGYVPKGLRFELAGRLKEDIDGRPRVSTFRDVYDTWDRPVHGYLTTAFLEALDRGPLERARVGRQYYEQGVNVRFDGALLESTHLGDAVKLLAYGGVPVHLFESSPRGDWLVGGAIELVAITRTEVRFDYVHLSDARPDLARAKQRDGVARDAVRDDDLFQLTVKVRPTEELGFLVRASTFLRDATRVEAEVVWRDADADLVLRARWEALIGAPRERTIDFAPFDAVLGRYEPYHSFRADVRKGLGDHLALSTGASVRDLFRDRDEGPFNRELVRVYGQVDVMSWPWEGLDLTGTVEWYRDLARAGVSYFTGTGEASQRIGDVTVSGGSSYAAYKQDTFFIDERENVRTYFGRLVWRPVRWLRLRLSYELEVNDEERTHVVRADVRFSY